MSRTTGIRIRPVSATQVPHLPKLGPCPVPMTADALWARAAERTWGLAGNAFHQDGEVVGFLLVAPALYVPRRHPLTRGGLGVEEAALLAVWIRPGEADSVGRQLVQHLAGRLANQKHLTGLDAHAGLTPGRVTPATPSAAWLTSVGFHPVDGCPGRFRLDFSATRTWFEDVASWLQAIRILPHSIPPEPASLQAHPMTEPGTPLRN